MRDIVRFDLGKQTSEVFFRKVKFWPGDPPPTFVSLDLSLWKESVINRGGCAILSCQIFHFLLIQFLLLL